MISSGRLAKLEGELSMQKNLCEEMKKNQAEMDDFVQVHTKQERNEFQNLQIRFLRNYKDKSAAAKFCGILKKFRLILDLRVAKLCKSSVLLFYCFWNGSHAIPL